MYDNVNLNVFEDLRSHGVKYLFKMYYKVTPQFITNLIIPLKNLIRLVEITKTIDWWELQE